MEGSIGHLQKELGSLRTGRAALSLLDGIVVEYYGTPTPLRQVATLSIPESRLITIQPWEPPLVPEIEKAILRSDLGLTPTNDGKLIRLPIPPLTEERRRELVRKAKKIGEEVKVAVRNVRRDVIEDLRKMKTEGKLGEDDFHLYQEEIQKITDQFISRADEILKKKEEEILKF